MNEDLKFTFQNINDWLKFAEAKNAGLLAINVACIMGVLQTNGSNAEGLQLFILLILLLLCLSSCFCFYSILPVLNKWFKFYKKLSDDEFQTALKNKNLNPLYFGDIVKLSQRQFIQLYNQTQNVNLSDADTQLAGQICVNSEISWQKYILFTIAAYMSFSTFVIAIFLVIVHSIR